MPTVEISIKGLNELFSRMKKFPGKFKRVVSTGLDASLLILWEKVPPYPAKPADSTYRRTGMLGRSLGSSSGGGKSGSRPDIYEKKIAGKVSEARFGTNLDYAKYVIGEQEQATQNKHWWKIGKILKDSVEKITTLWVGIADKMAAFLDRKS